MIFDLFTTIITLFQKHRKDTVGHESDVVHIRKRLLLHKNIPDLLTIKTLTGERFSELQNIFNSFDPIKTEKLSDNPKKYELLTKTVIYKLPKQRSKESIADMVYVEFSLWFKHAYNDYKKKDELIDEIYNFKRTKFMTNPFTDKVNWVYQKAVTDGDRYEIDGLNIWDYKWRDTGERINIKELIYNQDHTFNVWEISKDDIKVTFAAGEFSNLIWGIYLTE